MRQHGPAFWERQPHHDPTRIGHAVTPQARVSDNNAGPDDSRPQGGAERSDLIEYWQLAFAVELSKKEADFEADLDTAIDLSKSEQAKAPPGGPPNALETSPNAAGDPPGGDTVKRDLWADLVPISYGPGRTVTPPRPNLRRGTSRESGRRRSVSFSGTFTAATDL